MESIIFNLPETFDANRLLSLTSVRAKFFPNKNDDEALVNFEERYNPKVLEGNWFERRLPPPSPFKNDWKTMYKADYIHHVNDSFKSQQIQAWNNKLDFEEMFVDGLGEDDSTCRWQSTYQLGYNRPNINTKCNNNISNK